MTTESTEQRMPYAPPSTVLGVIRRYRERGLPEPVTLKTLQQIQVSEGNAPRTLQTLKMLGLLNEEGYPTDVFVTLAQTKPPEYPDAFAEIVRAFYRPIFTIVDPAQDDYDAIDNAFWGYEPRGQRQRMVRLFVGLCDEANLIPEEHRAAVQPSSGKRQSSTQFSSRRTQRTQKPKPAHKSKTEAQEPETPAAKESPRREAENGAQDYPAIAVIMGQLPPDGKWTAKRRRLWIQAMISAVDLSVDVEDDGDVVYEGEVVPERSELE